MSHQHLAAQVQLYANKVSSLPNQTFSLCCFKNKVYYFPGLTSRFVVVVIVVGLFLFWAWFFPYCLLLELACNSRSSCLYLPSARIAGVYHRSLCDLVSWQVDGSQHAFNASRLLGICGQRTTTRSCLVLFPLTLKLFTTRLSQSLKFPQELWVSPTRYSQC
jgi:hypothetical protein